MRADENANIVEGCTAEELLACIASDNYDTCVASCGSEKEEDITWNAEVTVSRVWSASTQEVASNAVNKKVGSIKLTAWDEKAKVSSIVVKNSGLSDAENISLKLFVNWKTASKIVSLRTSTDWTTIKFKPALEINAGKSETVDVYAYLNDYSNATHTITVSDVVVNGKSKWLPIELWTLKTTSYEVYSVRNVTITTPTSAISAISAGKTNELLATIALDMPVDGTINGLTIKNAGKTNLDEAIANVKAYYNNDVIGNVTVTDDEIIVTDLNIKTEADTITIKLKWDAVLMEDTCDIDLYVDLFGVDAIESSTNESMNTIWTWEDVNGDDKFDTTNDDRHEQSLNINGVDLKITKTSTWKQTVAPWTSNVVLYEATITSNTEFEVAGYELTTNATDFNNFRWSKVVLNIDGVSTDLTYAELWALDDEFTVDANRPVKVKVTANIKENVTNASYTFTFRLTDLNNAEWDAITFAWKERQGDVTEIEAGDLTLTAASEAADASRRLYSNGTDIEVARFNMEAWSQDVTLSTIELTNNFTETSTEFKLWNNDLTAAISSVRLVNAETNEEISDSCDVEALKVTCDMGDYVVKADEDFDVKVLVNLWNADYNAVPFVDNATTPSEYRRNLNVKVDITEWKVWTQTWTTKSYPSTNTYVLWSRPANVTLEKVNSNVFKVTIENKDENAIALNEFDFRFKPLSGDNYVATDKYCIRDLWSNVDNCTSSTEKFDLSDSLATFTFADLTTMPALLQKWKKVSFEVYVDSTYANPSLQWSFLRLETSTQEDTYSKYAQ